MVRFILGKLRKMLKLLAVGLGGFVGASARYSLSDWIGSRWGTKFPWSTLAVNVLGCLLIGVFLGWISSRETGSRTGELFLVPGILGSLTTFSTFGHETIKLVHDGALGSALGNIALNVVVGLVAVSVGLALMRSPAA